MAREPVDRFPGLAALQEYAGDRFGGKLPLARFGRAISMLAHADVGGEGRGEAAGGGHCSGTPALRRPSKKVSSPASYIGSSLTAVRVARAQEMV